MGNRTLFIFCLILFCVSCTAQYESYFPCTPTLENPYGVTSHITRKGDRWNFDTRKDELASMNAIGLNWCRSNLDAYNAGYSTQDSKSLIFDDVYKDLKKNQIEFLPILSDYHGGQFAWQGDWYEKYLRNLSEKYGNYSRYWEVMNEMDHPNNIAHFDHGCIDYVNVLKQTYEILKRDNPDAQILCSSLCDLSYSFLDSLSELNAYNYFDIVNIHSYSEPEALPNHFKTLKDHMDKYGWSKRVWLTESGMSSMPISEVLVNKNFFRLFLPSALKRLGMSMKGATISVLRDNNVGYSALNDDEINEWIRPICGKIQEVSFSDLKSLSISSYPVLIVSQTSDFPMSYMDGVVDYVKRGGTIVLAGGTPLYYDIQIDHSGVVERKQVNDTYYSRLHMSALFWWLDKAKKKSVPKVPTYVKPLSSNYSWTFNETYSSRFMGTDQLRGNDSLITLIEAGDKNFKGCVAGIYKLDSDLKGNVIFQTREGLRSYSREDLEQARRLPRIFLISYACGVDKVFWYNYRSCEESDTDRESHFGLTHKNLTPKKSYYSYKTLIEMLPDGSSRPKMYVKGNLYVVKWRRPDRKYVTAIWRRKGVGNEKLTLDSKCELYDLYGNRLKKNNEILLSEEIIYCVNQEASPIPIEKDW